MTTERLEKLKAMQAANKSMMQSAEKLYLQTHQPQPLPFMFLLQAS